MTIKVYIWESARPITFIELGPKIHIEPMSLLYFCIKIVPDACPSLLYISVHYSHPGIELQTKQILQNAHMTIIFERQSERTKDPWAWMVVMMKEGKICTTHYGLIFLCVSTPNFPMPNFPQMCPINMTSISTTIVEILKFFDKSNHTNICKIEVTTHNPNFRCWNFIM